MTTVPPFANSLAVVIGIDHYGNGIPALRTAANDARRVASTLAESHGYEVIQLLDGEASLERLTTLLTTELPARIGPDDRVFFYWAGHGVALDGDTGPNGYLLPSDARRGEEASFLHMPLVHDALLALPCRHMLVVLDSCFSGAFRWSGTRGVSFGDEVIHEEKYQRFVRDQAWEVITSSAQDQKALDQLSSGALGTRDGAGGHSPFALALFKALEGEADVMGGQDGDGLVTAHELFLYIDDQLQTAALDAGTRQTPGLWPLKKHDKGQFVFFVPGKALTLPPAPELTFTNNPWRGLNSYDAADKDLFFGRDAQIAALREHVDARPLTVVLGASGTGKSSLVKAGLVPRLVADGWHVLPIMRPGSSPLKALAQAIDAPYLATATMMVASARQSTSDAIRSRLRELLSEQDGGSVALVIDQFEEMITLARSDERDEALALLGRLQDEHGTALHLVITLRSDFEPNFDRTAFGDRWRSGRFVVQPMSRDDLRAVIEMPAARRVLYFDPSALVETLLDEVIATPGVLPLLSFALSEMYVRYVKRQGTDRSITREDYDALGGVVGALRARAEAEYEAMNEAQRGTVQRVMLRMVAADGGNITRRRVTDSELDYTDPAENSRREEVVQRLTDARLLVTGKEPDGEPFVEPAHDALVRGWGRLIAWVQQAGGDTVPLVTRHKLGLAATEWSRADAALQGGLLWSDPVRSAMLAPVVKARVPWMNRQELAFAVRSIRGRRIRRMVTMALTALIAALGVGSIILGQTAKRNGDEAKRKGEEAVVAGNAAIEAARKAEAEKVRTVRSLFSSLTLFLSNGNPGSVCVRPSCGALQGADSTAWISILRVPDHVARIPITDGEEASRDFIVAREYGAGHVLVYAHDGLATDRESTKEEADNMVFAENALRWLAATSRPAGCPPAPTILLWEGTFVRIDGMQKAKRFIDHYKWALQVTSPETLEEDLRCATVLWYLSDWTPPENFAASQVPLIEQFVTRGGGLLVGGLQWSYFQQGSRDRVYAANELGKPFGFAFTLDAFEKDSSRPLPLLSNE
jgi:hypothetical protein